MITRFDGYGSHTLLLDEIFRARSIKKVLEFGVGEYSTTFFERDKGINLTSIESESFEWLTKMKDIKPDIVWMPDLDEVLRWADNLAEMYDLIFIDTVNDIRWKLIDRLQKNTRIVVVHDTEQSNFQYDLCTIRNGFCFTDFVLFRPWTGVFTDDIEMLDILKKNNPFISYTDFNRDKIYIN
jgi:hypothetical protein